MVRRPESPLADERRPPKTLYTIHTARTGLRFQPARPLTVCTCVHILQAMANDAEWDTRKAAANLKKHGVDFADAATVLHDEQAITVLDDEADEERYVTIGMDALGRVLVSCMRGAATGRA